MSPEEATKLGIELENPPGENCQWCSSPDYSCGSRQSVKSFHGKCYFRSSLCFMRGEGKVLDAIQQWRKEEEASLSANNQDDSQGPDLKS